MVFTKNKAFITILYLILGYGLRGNLRNFPGKGWSRFAFDNLITKLPKKGCPSASMVEVYRPRIMNDAIGLNVCWWMVDILSPEKDAIVVIPASLIRSV